MKNFVPIMSCLSVLSASCVLVLTGMKGYGVNINQEHISLAANLMYSFVILASLFILYKELKTGNMKWLIAFSLPIDTLILSVILSQFDIQFHPLIIFLFDVYVIILFSFYLGAKYYSENNKIALTNNATS